MFAVKVGPRSDRLGLPARAALGRAGPGWAGRGRAGEGAEAAEGAEADLAPRPVRLASQVPPKPRLPRTVLRTLPPASPPVLVRSKVTSAASGHSRVSCHDPALLT